MRRYESLKIGCGADRSSVIWTYTFYAFGRNFMAILSKPHSEARHLQIDNLRYTLLYFS